MNENPLIFTVHEYPVTTLRGEEIRVEVSQTVNGDVAAIHMDVLLFDGITVGELYASRKHAAEFCVGVIDMYRSKVSGVWLNPCLEFKGFPAESPAEAYTLTAERHEKPQWVRREEIHG